jgi:single-strand DNA-binding protein
MVDLRLPNLNRVYLSGRMTRDPEVRQLKNGLSVCNARMAVNHPYRDSNGDWQQEETFVTVVAWRRWADLCGEFLHRGSPLLVEGRLRSRSWEGQDGQTRNVLEVQASRIHFLERSGSSVKEAELETVEEEG